MAATVPWWFISTEPNGILAALTALQVHDLDAVAHEKSLKTSEIQGGIRYVVFVMELASVSGSAFLLLLSSSFIGTLIRYILLALFGGNVMLKDAIAKIFETVVFGWGLVTFMGWFFRQPTRYLVQTLMGFGMSGMKTCSVSVLLHSAAIAVLAQDQELVSWTNVESVVYRPDGTAKILQNLLLIPIKEELFFRGVIVLVGINRLQSVQQSAFISAVLFATIHLVNARHLETQYTASYVVFQVFWAFLVGFFLALKFAVSNSVVECFILHMINNTFALGVSKTSAIELTQPFVAFSLLAALMIYFVAIARQLQLLRSDQLEKRQ